jgi:hypothetical protein
MIRQDYILLQYAPEKELNILGKYKMELRIILQLEKSHLIYG